jgi:cell division protein FtsL
MFTKTNKEKIMDLDIKIILIILGILLMVAVFLSGKKYGQDISRKRTRRLEKELVHQDNKIAKLNKQIKDLTPTTNETTT